MSEEKVNIEISKESYDFLKSLAAEIKTQDNRSTAKPYFFALRVPREYPVADGSGHDRIYYIDKHGNEPWSSKEALLENDPEHPEDDIREVHSKDHWEVENVFLTKRGYDEHIRLNRHNLRTPEDFLYHAFRNPEFMSLFKFLAEMEAL